MLGDMTNEHHSVLDFGSYVSNSFVFLSSRTMQTLQYHKLVLLRFYNPSINSNHQYFESMIYFLFKGSEYYYEDEAEYYSDDETANYYYYY